MTTELRRMRGAGDSQPEVAARLLSAPFIAGIVGLAIVGATAFRPGGPAPVRSANPPGGPGAPAAEPAATGAGATQPTPPVPERSDGGRSRDAARRPAGSQPLAPRGEGNDPARTSTNGIAQPDPAEPLRDLRETHLGRIRQLTVGGENAEAYFDASGRRLIFQSTRDGRSCDQIYTMTSAGKDVRLVSTGRGRCTCAYWFPDGKRIVYSSTHLSSDACPPRPDYSKGYVWALHEAYEIFIANADGSDPVRLTDHPGYDAEATVSEDGSRIVFTSLREGDVDLYTMSADGKDVRRVTREPGYDGGAFFSPDGKRLVYRASRPRSTKLLEDWNALLKERLVRPTTLEIQVSNADGTGARAVTALGAASFAPCWLRDGRRILFASNHADTGGRNFDLYLVNDDGTGLERVTWCDRFDGFPIVSRDGKSIAFASNRGAAGPGETNIFIADWVP